MVRPGLGTYLAPFSRPIKPALTGVRFRVAAGESLAIVGANGAGKSTLLRILTAFLLTKGNAAINGRDVVREPTHNRMDALFFGVLTGYFHHFRPSVLEGLMRGTLSREAIGAASVFLLSFSYFFPIKDTNYMFSTIGFTFIFLGFGGMLLLSLYVHGILPKGIAWFAEKIGSAFAFAGVYFYSIYLRHGPAG